MRIKVYCATTDTDYGLHTSLHSSERAAYHAVATILCNTNEICYALSLLHADDEMSSLQDYLQDVSTGSLDTYNVTWEWCDVGEHESELNSPPDGPGVGGYRPL